MFFRRNKSSIAAAERDVPLPGRDYPMAVADAHAILGTPMTPPFPDGMEQLVVAMGCFWGPERAFWQTDGVHTTAAGYAGGSTPNPNYAETSSGQTGHAEAVLVVYDPTVVDIQDLFRLFWEQHDPTTPRPAFGFGSNYRSALYTFTDEQLVAAEASRQRYQARLTERGFQKIRTEIGPAGPFYYAEDRHQQYLHKNPRALCPHGFCQVGY